MSRISLAVLLSLVITGVRLPAGDALPATTPAPAATQLPPADTQLPEVRVMAWAKALQADDYKGMLAMLPPEVRAQAAERWTRADPTEDKDLDAKLQLVLAPNAIDSFMADLTPKLATMDPATMAQSLTSIAGVLPLMLQSNQPAQPASDQTAILTAAQNLLSDIAAWLPGSGITDPNDLRKALTDLIDAVKESGITSAADMRKLGLEAFIGKFGPMMKKVKAALMVYGLDANHLLASVSATGAAGADATHRSITVGFTAFGRQYSITLPLVQQNGSWTVPTQAIPGYDNLKTMIPALGGPAMAPAPTPADGNEGRKPDGPIGGAAPAAAPAPAPGPSGQGGK